MNGGLVIGTAVTGKPAYVVLGFAGIGVFVSARAVIRATRKIQQFLDKEI